ncbi:MAG: HDOD domain-containing protein [Polyangiaceae bacterium]
MSEANRVLLVDDETSVTDSLRKALQPLRASWTIESATSARGALELIDRQPFDVVIADMQMPEMDGAGLLAVVKEMCPAAARVICSTRNEKSHALRAVRVAHRFLHKPCPPGTLIEFLARRAKIAKADETIRERVGAISMLPCDSETAVKLECLVEETDLRLDIIAEAVESEPVLIMKMLQLASSSFFGVKRQTDDVRSAVAFAGRELLTMLAHFAVESSTFEISAKELDLPALRFHGAAVAAVAKKSAGQSPHADACFVAGMLHDVGKIVMAIHEPETFDAISVRARTENISFEKAEIAEGVRTHTAAGAALVELWGLPQTVVDAVAKQHDDRYDIEYLDPTAAVRLAHNVPMRAIGRH